MGDINLDSIEFDLTEGIEDLILHIKKIKIDVELIKKHLNLDEEIKLPIHKTKPKKFI